MNLTEFTAAILPTFVKGVKRGARRLDKKRPGWAAMVNAAELNMRDCSECVLGQVCGQFGTGVREVVAEPPLTPEDDIHYTAAGAKAYERANVMGFAISHRQRAVTKAKQAYYGAKTGAALARAYDLSSDRMWAVLKKLWLAEVKTRMKARK